MDSTDLRADETCLLAAEAELKGAAHRVEQRGLIDLFALEGFHPAVINLLSALGDIRRLQLTR